MGDCVDARNLKELKRAAITHIVIVAAELDPVFPKTFNYLKINASDIETFVLSDYFD